MRPFFFFVLFIFLIKNNLFAQRMVYDSIMIDFGTPKATTFGVVVNTVWDERKQNPKFIGVHESKKYLFVPVDRFVALENSLTHEIAAIFPVPTVDSLVEGYKLIVKEFDVVTQTQFLSTRYVTNATISVWQCAAYDHSEMLGNLIYNESATAKRSKPKEISGYVASLDAWKQRFAADMIKLSVCSGSDGYCGLHNLYGSHESLNKNLLGNLEVAFWWDTWLVDGEIIFSRPEASKRFFRKAYSMRYRNEPKFQAIEFSMGNDQLNFRLSENLITTLKSKYFFGFNLWNDDEYEQRKFEDALIFDYSLGQYILLNPYRKKGITGGVGVMGSVTFIYTEGFSFKPFITAQIGIKF